MTRNTRPLGARAGRGAVVLLWLAAGCAPEAAIPPGSVVAVPFDAAASSRAAEPGASPQPGRSWSVTQVAAGGFHTCVVLGVGRVRCWGSGFFGSLGYGNPKNVGDKGPPAEAGDVNVGGKVVQLAAGNDFTCALLERDVQVVSGRG